MRAEQHLERLEGNIDGPEPHTAGGYSRRAADGAADNEDKRVQDGYHHKDEHRIDHSEEDPVTGGFFDFWETAAEAAIRALLSYQMLLFVIRLAKPLTVSSRTRLIKELNKPTAVAKL